MRLCACRAAPAIQRAALPPTGAEASTAIDAALPFLDAYVHAAEQAGAAPHLDLQDRVAMGVTRAPDTHFPSAMPYHGSLKFQAYEVAQMPVALPAAAPAAAAAPSADFFDGLDLGGLSVSSSVAAQPAVQQPPALHPTPPTQAPVEQLRVSKQGRRWGPGAVPHPTPATPPSPSGGQALAPLSGSSAGASTYVDGGYKRAQPAPAPAASAHIDPEQQRLAASLFGGGGGAAARSAGVKKNAGSSAGHAARAPEIDLLGEAFGSEQVTAGNGSGAGVAGGGADNGGLLGADFMGLQVPASASDAGAQGSDPLAALSELNMPAFGGGGFATEQGHGGFGLLSAPQSRAPAPAPAVQQQPAKQQDPFASLLD